MILYKLYKDLLKYLTNTDAIYILKYQV